MSVNEPEIQQRLSDLIERTGYPVSQDKGQRKYGPPPHWNGPPPGRGCEVFICKLPRDVFEYDLVPVFEQVGTIYELRLMMDYSGRNRGFGFVNYANPREADQAIVQFNNYEVLPGKRIFVLKSLNNCRLFIGNIPKTISRQDIQEELQKMTDGVVDVILYPSMTDKRKNRGFAFVEYESHRAAVIARRNLVPGPVLWGVKLAVDWAQPEPEVDELIMSKVTILYVRNLTLRTSELTLQACFEEVVGPRVICKVKRMRDFAFVHFVSRAAAEKGLALNGQYIDGAVIEVNWAKPPSCKRDQENQTTNHRGRRQPGRIQYNRPNRPFGETIPMSPTLPFAGMDNFHGPCPQLNMNVGAALDPYGVPARSTPLPSPLLNSQEKLNAFCCAAGLPMPTVSALRISGDNNRDLYIGMVTFPFSNQTFRVPFPCETAEAARIAAAEYTAHLLFAQSTSGIMTPLDNSPYACLSSGVRALTLQSPLSTLVEPPALLPATSQSGFVGMPVVTDTTDTTDIHANE